jgi:hypothetical protein
VVYNKKAAERQPILIVKWWPGTGSNRRHADFQTWRVDFCLQSLGRVIYSL